MDLHALWFPEHCDDLYSLCVYNNRSPDLPPTERIPTSEFASAENASIIAHILRVCGLHKSVVATQHSGYISAG